MHIYDDQKKLVQFSSNSKSMRQPPSRKIHVQQPKSSPIRREDEVGKPAVHGDDKEVGVEKHHHNDHQPPQAARPI